jgi:hypothetical protein
MAEVIEMFDTEKEIVLSKKEHVKNYLKDLAETEAAMDPFKEHKRDVRKSYIDNEWLTKDEMWAAVKAYRMVKSDKDIDALVEAYDLVKKMAL